MACVVDANAALLLVAAISIGVASSKLYTQNKCDSGVSEFLNCVVLEKKLHGVLEELESAKLIIKFLQQESDEDFPHDTRTSMAINSPRGMSAVMFLKSL